jgi:hypothetical protein
MVLLQVILILAAVTVIFWWTTTTRSEQTDGSIIRMPTILVSGWLISAAMFGPNFYAIRVPGVFDITIERILFLLMIFSMGIGMWTGKFSGKTPIGVEILMFGFIVLCILSMLRTGFFPYLPQYTTPWYAFITGYLFPFLAFWFAKHYLAESKDIRTVLITLWGIGAYIGLIAFLEYFDFKQFIFPRYIANPEFELHLDRARGPFLNSAVNGTAILFGLICAFHLAFLKKGLFRILIIFSLPLFFAAVFFTLTRSVYLGLILVLVVFYGWYKTPFPKWKLFSIPLALILLAGMLSFPRLLSQERREGGIYQVDEVKVRLALILRSIEMVSEHPFVGVGLSQFVPASTQLYKARFPFLAESEREQLQHHHLLGLAVELGIFGLFIYLSIIFLVFRRLKQLKEFLPRSGIDSDNLRIVISAIWIIYLCTNFFIEPSNHLFLNVVPFLFAGIADGIYHRGRQADWYSAVSGGRPIHV